MTHNLILPDEYDRINLDLAPFWALPRDEMRKRVDEVEKMPQTFTLIVKDGNVEIEVRLALRGSSSAMLIECWHTDPGQVWPGLGRDVSSSGRRCVVSLVIGIVRSILMPSELL